MKRGAGPAESASAATEEAGDPQQIDVPAQRTREADQPDRSVVGACGHRDGSSRRVLFLVGRADAMQAPLPRQGPYQPSDSTAGGIGSSAEPVGEAAIAYCSRTSR
ncbi:hypothetical protein GCM10010417_01570 [Streptomyces carpaticus]